MLVRLSFFRTNLALDRAVTFVANVRNALPFKTRCALGLAVGISLAWICSVNAAYALNGITYVTTCNTCQTTADFNNAAAAAAEYLQTKGTYYAVSAFQASSAFVRVDGHFQFRNGEDYWVLVSTTPIDASGNSLAGNTESANESYFASLDQVLFGANRNTPQVVNEPPDYAGSFINSTEEEVVPGIGFALIQMGINPASFTVGTLITVKFQDGTTAQYIKVSNTGSYQWSWTGIAHNKDGKLIDRLGNLIIDPNTTGTGGGTYSGPGFNPGPDGAPWWFEFWAPGQCEYGGTISGDGFSLTDFGIGPC